MLLSKIAIILFTQMSILSHYTPSPYLKDANKVRDETIVEIEDSTPLRAAGVAGAMLGSIKMLGLTFESKQKFSIDQAREYTIYCARKLLVNINNNKEIEPYLTPSPFGPKNIEISLFVGRFRPENTLDELSMVVLEDGIIRYTSIDGKTYKSELLHKETYEEALEIVQEKVEAMEDTSHSQKNSKGLFRKFIGFFR